MSRPPEWVRHGDRDRRPATRRTGRGLLIGAAALLLAVVAGILVTVEVIGGNSSAGTDPASPNAQAGRPPTGAAPVLSAGAQANTRDGAVAFAHYWFDTLNYAVDTGNVSALTAASSPACTACVAAIGVVTNAYRNGGRLVGGEYTLRNVATDNLFNIARPVLSPTFDRTPRSTVDSDGRQLDSLAGVSFVNGTLILERVTDHWRVREVFAPSRFA